MNTQNPQRLLLVVILLQLIILAGQWLGQPAATPASAQVPDGGAQRAAMVDEQKETNAKFDKLLDLLASGKLQVRAAASDDKK